jgi:intracellular sulfur oxidation DsrE/DsrF family protein
MLILPVNNLSMKKIILLLFVCLHYMFGFSQSADMDSALNAINLQKDSAFRASMHADSVKINKEYKKKANEAKIRSQLQYPAINGGENSGIVPVKDPTEIPDPNLDYKLLFELTANNPDSAINEINYGLAEVARVINLHVASGIPLKKIFPVIVVHAGALNAITNNAFYQERYKMDNPNLKLIDDLRNIGTKFIACGQALAFFDIKREALLPTVKVSLTAQTVLSSYRLKGYLKYW